MRTGQSFLHFLEREGSPKALEKEGLSGMGRGGIEPSTRGFSDRAEEQKPSSTESEDD